MDIIGIAIRLTALLISVIIHEVMHGYVALLLGDTTARDRGRLTLNPVAHVDPFGSILLPLLLILANSSIIFGSAKPVPINPYRFNDPVQGMMYVGLAGPLSNLALAIIGALLLRLIGPYSSLGAMFFQSLVLLNVILAVFNLVPIPPLDGSRVLSAFLPRSGRAIMDQLEQFGLLLLLVLLFSFGGFFWKFVIGPPVQLLLRLLGLF